jgi:protein-tyrosine phosphatase
VSRPTVLPDGPADPATVRASVLVVCTGNVCRSPAAELLLASRLAGAGVRVTSAGTRALVGEPVHPPMAGLLREAGVDPASFVARVLGPAELRSADLVLTMTRAHRAAVATLLPAAVRRTFLLLEMAGIAASVAADGWPEDVPPTAAARLAALPGLAARHRRPADATDLEVPDPYRRPAEEYRRSLAALEAAVDTLAHAVRPAPPSFG